MKPNRRKAFTLVEMLTVVVIVIICGCNHSWCYPIYDEKGNKSRAQTENPTYDLWITAGLTNQNGTAKGPAPLLKEKEGWIKNW